jgi:hypothetical protein
MRRYSIAVTFLLMGACSAFSADAPAQVGNPTFDIKVWIAVCAALGTLTTAIVNVVRWIRERSSIARKVEAASHALQLKEFIVSEKELGVALGLESCSQSAISAARAELRAVVAKLDPPPRPLSKLRRLMLFYAPSGWRAWLAHSLFYTVCIFCGAFAIAAGLGGVQDDFTFNEIIELILSLVCYGTLFQRWATVEQRISSNLAIKSRPIGPVSWYPANNRYGFLAQIMLALAVVQIVFFFAPFSPVSVPSPSVPFTAWELALAVLIHAAFLPVGYSWAELEYKHSEHPLVRQNLCDFLKMACGPQTAEQFAGSIAFVSMTVWNIILLIDLRGIPKLASFPDTSGFGQVGQVGVVKAALIYLLLVATAGWLPWLAVYRGLWVLYQNEDKLRERSQETATEDSNG